LLGLVPFDVSSSSSCCSLPNDGFPFGETEPLLLIDALLLNVATPDVVCEVLEVLLTLFNLPLVPVNRFELGICTFFLNAFFPAQIYALSISCH
jgi:hypothetical protein